LLQFINYGVKVQYAQFNQHRSTVLPVNLSVLNYYPTSLVNRSKCPNGRTEPSFCNRTEPSSVPTEYDFFSRTEHKPNRNFETYSAHR